MSCAYCGGEFQPDTSTRKFCSHTCYTDSLSQKQTDIKRDNQGYPIDEHTRIGWFYLFTMPKPNKMDRQYFCAGPRLDGDYIYWD